MATPYRHAASEQPSPRTPDRSDLGPLRAVITASPPPVVQYRNGSPTSPNSARPGTASHVDERLTSLQRRHRPASCSVSASTARDIRGTALLRLWALEGHKA